jgi:hypothetical protein
MKAKTIGIRQKKPAATAIPTIFVSPRLLM